MYPLGKSAAFNVGTPMQVMCPSGWGGTLAGDLLPYLTEAAPDVLCLQEVIDSPETDKALLTDHDGDHILPQRANLFREVSPALPDRAASVRLSMTPTRCARSRWSGRPRCRTIARSCRSCGEPHKWGAFRLSGLALGHPDERALVGSLPRRVGRI